MTLPPFGNDSGRRCPHRLGNGLWNGDEDVATPFHAGAVSRCALGKTSLVLSGGWTTVKPGRVARMRMLSTGLLPREQQDRNPERKQTQRSPQYGAHRTGTQPQTKKGVGGWRRVRDCLEGVGAASNFPELPRAGNEMSTNVRMARDPGRGGFNLEKAVGTMNHTNHTNKQGLGLGSPHTCERRGGR